MTNPDPTPSPSPTPPENSQTISVGALEFLDIEIAHATRNVRPVEISIEKARRLRNYLQSLEEMSNSSSSESVPKISAGVSEEERVSVLRINRDFLAAEQLRLLRMIEVRDTVIDQMRVERVLLAKLASDKPQFDNPLVAWKAQELRDKILSEEAPDVR